MSGYTPSPADYAGFLMAARQQQLLLLQHLQRTPPATPARTSQSSLLEAAPPDPKDLVPLQPLLPDWMANAFGIPLLNMPVGECRGMPRVPLPVPQPYAIPPALWGSMGHRPLAPPQVPLGNGGQRPAQNLMEQQCLFPPGVSFPHPMTMNLINGARPGHPYPFPFPPVPELSPTMDQKDANACAAGSLRGLLIPPVPHVPPVGNVLASPPPEQTPTKLKRPAEKPRDNDLEEGNGEYPVKRTRLVWTPHLHRLFVDAVEKLGEDAVPKNIMQVMDVDGLTRSNVASHLQKYRLQLKKQPRNASRRTPGAEDGKAPAKPKFPAQVGNIDNGRRINGVAPNLACTTERKCTNAEECRHDHVQEGGILGNDKRGNGVHPSIQPLDTVMCAGMDPAGVKSDPMGWERDNKTKMLTNGDRKKNSGSEKQSCVKLMGNGGPHRPNHAGNFTNGTNRSTHDFNPDLDPESVDC